MFVRLFYCTPDINSEVQVVISGHTKALQRASELARTRGVRRVTPLAVSAPFHCSLMRPAAARLSAHLCSVNIATPRVPLISNVTGAAVSQPDILRQLLEQQIYSPVQWLACVRTARTQHTLLSTLEVGAGDVLSKLVKRIEPLVHTRALSSTKELNFLLQK